MEFKKLQEAVADYPETYVIGTGKNSREVNLIETPTPYRVALTLGLTMKELEEQLFEADDNVKKLWELYQMKHIDSVYKWAKREKQKDIVLKIENDKFKTIREDGAETDVRLIINMPKDNE